MGTYLVGMWTGFALGFFILATMGVYSDIEAEVYIARYTQGEEVCKTFGGLDSLDMVTYTCKDTTIIQRRKDYE